VARLIGRNRTNAKVSKKPRHRYAHKIRKTSQLVDTDRLKGYTCSKENVYKYLINGIFVDRCTPIALIPRGAIPYFGNNIKNNNRKKTIIVDHKINANGDISGTTSINDGHSHEFIIKTDNSVIIKNHYHRGDRGRYHNHEYIGRYPHGHLMGNKGIKPHSHKLLTNIINNMK